MNLQRLSLGVLGVSKRVRAHLRARGFGVAAMMIVPAAGGVDDDEEGGRRGCAASSLFSQSEAPDMDGAWAVTYEDDLEVEITIGGAVYTEYLGAQGGAIDIEHDGQPLTFDLDCAAEAVVCPSEAWPELVQAEHRQSEYPHQVTVTLPGQECLGELVEPAPDACGPDTANPDCDEVCEGELVITEVDRLGAIDEDGEYFDLLLGAGVASNGVNCALLGLSLARADIVSTDPALEEPWEAIALENGEVVTGYAGACLWAGDPDDDGTLEALVLGATVVIRSHFSAEKAA